MEHTCDPSSREAEAGYPEDEGELPQATDNLRKRATGVQTIFIAFG